MTVPVAHVERAHALLSASSSHKWLHCTPSARLEETLPDTTSKAAKEGTLAHEIAELKLRRAFVEPITTRSFNSRMKKFQEHELYDDEMQRHTDTYLEYIQGIVHSFSSPPYVAIEKRIDYSSYAPEGFGTGDCILIGGNTLYVNDFKYGKGVAVSAFENPQMKLYALGVYLEYSFLYRIERVQMSIIQPRLNDISEYTIPIDELLEWGESIKPIARMAFVGEGEYAPGAHCGFCRARTRCAALVEKYTALEDFKKMKPPLISYAEVGDILARAEGLVSWYKALEKDALAEVLRGGDVAGWKAVHGRSSRDYVDLDAAIKHLTANGIDEAVLFERKPLTVPKVEEILKSAQYKALLVEPGHVVVKPGAPTLAPLTDKRDPITRTSAADDFSTSEEAPSNE